MVFNIRHVIIIALVSIVCFTSCGMIVINGSGYESLTKEEKSRIKLCSSTIDSLRTDGNAYEITGSQLKSHLKGFSKSIVYEWAPYCSNESCVSPAYAERICQERGYKFCLVAVTYDRLENAKGIKSPLLVISRTAYGTDNMKTYCDKFFMELTGKPHKELKARFHVFENGKYTHSLNEITDAPFINKFNSTIKRETPTSDDR